MQKAFVVGGVWWAVASGACLLACGDTGSTYSPSNDQACTIGTCCPEIDWILLAPTQAQVGATMGLQVSLHDDPQLPSFVRWLGEGGKIEHPLDPSASYICEWPGFHQVTLKVSNDWCEIVQQFRVECQAPE